MKFGTALAGVKACSLTAPFVKRIPSASYLGQFIRLWGFLIPGTMFLINKSWHQLCLQFLLSTLEIGVDLLCTLCTLIQCLSLSPNGPDLSSPELWLLWIRCIAGESRPPLPRASAPCSAVPSWRQWSWRQWSGNPRSQTRPIVNVPESAWVTARRQWSSSPGRDTTSKSTM